MEISATEFIGWTTLILAIKVIHNIVHFIYTTFLGRLLGKGVDLHKCGPWAVVTGATDGIGKSFAKLLAAADLNVVLVSRSPEKLKKVADEIRKLNRKIDVKTIAVDFSTESDGIYKILRRELAELEIGILINNVGMLVGRRQFFVNIPEEKSLHSIVNCNITSMVKMCYIVLPQMVERRSGVIVNIGSITSSSPTPKLTVYAATKAFVDKFSQDLAAEVRMQGITVQTVHPGYVNTKMNGVMKRSYMNPDPDSFAAATLNTLGLESRTGGYWVHKIQLYISDILNFFVPRSVLESLAIKFFKDLKPGDINHKSK